MLIATERINCPWSRSPKNALTRVAMNRLEDPIPIGGRRVHVPLRDERLLHLPLLCRILIQDDVCSVVHRPVLAGRGGLRVVGLFGEEEERAAGAGGEVACSVVGCKQRQRCA